ncbi:MAG: hypothetical protein U0694_27585 [Anaerolineae bacterium]
MMLYNYAALPDDDLRALETLVSGHNTLDKIVMWSATHGYRIAAMLAQDEFSHDIVVAYARGLYLAYDAT